MGWISLGTISLESNWKLTQPVHGEIFRIKHSPITNERKEYLKAVVSPAFIDSGMNIFNPKRLTYREENELLAFYFPLGLSLQSLAFKRLDNSDINWIIEAEVYQAVDQSEDFANYLIARFGKAMALYTRSSIQSLDVNSDAAQLTANQAVKLVASNSKRRALTIQNGDKSVTIAAQSDDKGNLSKVFITLLANEVYEFPVSQGSLYTGDVWVKSSTDARIGWTEFVAP